MNKADALTNGSILIMGVSVKISVGLALTVPLARHRQLSVTEGNPR